jgi:hypothetical protein
MAAASQPRTPVPGQEAQLESGIALWNERDVVEEDIHGAGQVASQPTSPANLANASDDEIDTDDDESQDKERSDKKRTQRSGS